MIDFSHVRRFRRSSLLALALCPVAVLTTVGAQTPPSDSSSFELSIPVSLLPLLRQDENFARMTVTGDPASVDPTRGLPLVYIAAGVLLLPELARSLIALYRDFKYGGTMIEVVGGKLVIRQDDRLDADTIVVKDASGKIAVHRSRSAASLDKWVELLAGARK